MNRKLLVLLVLCVIGGIVAYRMLGGDFNWGLFRSSLRNVKGSWLAASILLTMLTYLFRAIRWQVLLAPIKAVPLGYLTSTTVIGFAAIYLVGRAGELARPLWLTRRQGVPFSASVAAIVAERFFDAIMIVSVFAGALLTVQVTGDSTATLLGLKKAAWTITAGTAAVVAGLFIFRANSDRIVGLLPKGRISSWIDNFVKGLAFLGSGRTIVSLLACSAALWIAIVLQFWTMLLGMNFQFPIGAAALVLVGAALGSIAQIPGVGGGFQAGYIFCMTTFFGVPAEQAVATSLVATIISYVPTILVGILCMLMQGMSFRDLKAPVRAESESV